MVKWNVIAELWKKRKIPPVEILKSDYINNFLRPEDRDSLMETGDLLHRKLYERGIDVALLAVGSSTFSEYHWEVREQLTGIGRFLGKRGERRYADIDIRVIVERTSPALTQFDERNNRGLYGKVRDETRGVLSSHGYTVNDHRTVQNLREDRRSEDSARNRRMYGIELFSLTTTLRSCTPLDVIIREQQFPVQKELEKERSFYASTNADPKIGYVMNPFSVLYPSRAMSK